MFKPDSIHKYADIFPRWKKLFHLGLYGLTEDFDLASITDFLLKNEKLTVCLSYFNPLTDGYKEILEKFIVKIIETRPKRIPYIYFPGLQNSIFYDDYQGLRLSH
uniref:Uncharacterized protein n=1 Tax=Panagrolaimus superbus TaxID=310955 RepID=A0A914XSW7_9BILA